MDVYTLMNKWKQFVSNLNSRGIPVPTVRDPKTGMGSVSLTLVTVAAVLVIIGVIGKLSGKLGTIDIGNSLEFFYATSALYFGRNWVSKGGSKIDPSDENEPK